MYSNNFIKPESALKRADGEGQPALALAALFCAPCAGYPFTQARAFPALIALSPSTVAFPAHLLSRPRKDWQQARCAQDAARRALATQDPHMAEVLRGHHDKVRSRP